MILMSPFPFSNYLSIGCSLHVLHSRYFPFEALRKSIHIILILHLFYCQPSAGVCTAFFIYWYSPVVTKVVSVMVHHCPLSSAAIAITFEGNQTTRKRVNKSSRRNIALASWTKNGGIRRLFSLYSVSACVSWASFLCWQDSWRRGLCLFFDFLYHLHKSFKSQLFHLCDQQEYVSPCLLLKCV